jgi:hypothetical protein
MARKLRAEYPGAVYHLMSRGERREAIFKDDQDHERVTQKKDSFELCASRERLLTSPEYISLLSKTAGFEKQWPWKLKA